MTTCPRVPDLDPAEAGNLTVHLVAIREQLVFVREELAGLRAQQAAIHDLLVRVLQQPAAARSAAEPAAHPPLPPTEEVVGSCARDILRVIGEAGQPLTLIELLDELVQRHLSWRENTVRHALDELLDQGAITQSNNGQPHRYGLANLTDNPPPRLREQ
jgi:hypothetical protein